MVNSRAVPDNELNAVLGEIRERKPGAFERLLALVQSTTFSFGMKVCGGDPEDAQDTMQDTLLTVYQSFPDLHFEDSRALKVWLYKVAKNACLMMRRKGKFEPDRKLSLDDLKGSNEIPDWKNAPLKELLLGERKDMVHAAIRELPYDPRLVLVLRDMEQLSTKETAEVLGISEETVKIRLHRARASLRKFLQSL